MASSAWRVWSLIVAVALAAGGCLGGSSPVRRVFRLEVPAAPAVRDAALLPGTLLVELPRTDAVLAQRDLVFRPSPESSELRQYPYTRWSDAPAALVQQAMVERLSGEHVADRVLRADLGSPAEWLLVSRIDRFERVGGGDPRVQVVLELAWLRASSRDVVLSGRYGITRSTASDRVEDAATALGLALGEALDRAVVDLESADLGSTGS
jgi:ABC-type uncharacterized transport system auxiliary subunit